MNAPHHVHMPREPKTKHYIRAWRLHRDMTLEQLADSIGMSHQNLGKIERFKVPYNQVLLEQLSVPLRCDPVELIVRDPMSADPIWAVLDGMNASQREQLTEIAKTLKKSA